MKKVAVEEAVGMELCHDITAMFDGFKGALFKRGHIITEEDIPKLLDIGKKNIFVWEENAGEIHEEECALRMAAMTPVEGAHFDGPAEGKVVLMSDCQGLFRVDTKLQKQLNSIGDITISCIPDHFPVKPGMRLASMRIVPLVTKEQQIIDAEKYAAERKDETGKNLFEIVPYSDKKVGIIITGSEIYTGRIKDKFESVCRKKLEAYPCEIVGVKLCDDKLDMIVDSAKELMAAGADVLIFSGGMSVDPDDLTPTAIRQLGADVVSHGIPAQPGNMTMVAYLGDIALLGVPGAAISMPVTMFDVILPQVFAGIKFTKEDLVNMGEGGLCQQCKPCHFPFCTFGRY